MSAGADTAGSGGGGMKEFKLTDSEIIQAFLDYLAKTKRLSSDDCGYHISYTFKEVAMNKCEAIVKLEPVTPPTKEESANLLTNNLLDHVLGNHITIMVALGSLLNDKDSLKALEGASQRTMRILELRSASNTRGESE